VRHCAARKLATKMIRLLCELMKTFDDVPDERYLTMRLTYHKHTVRCTLPSPTTSTRYAALFPHPPQAHGTLHSSLTHHKHTVRCTLPSPTLSPPPGFLLAGLLCSRRIPSPEIRHFPPPLVWRLTGVMDPPA
jgi:hypothetical protein